MPFNYKEYYSDKEKLMQIFNHATADKDFLSSQIDMINTNTEKLLKEHNTYLLCGLTPFSKNAIDKLKKIENKNIGEL